MRKTHATQTLLLALALALSGCATGARSPLPVKSEDNTARLLAHPQFGRAAAVAPDFVNAALQTVTRLETDKANGNR
jgi:starvation-inducible outer membrane lipoprotein